MVITLKLLSISPKLHWSPLKCDQSPNSRCIALFADGDVLAVLLFATIGRLSHGLSVFYAQTLRTVDLFISGWFLSAYFLGGYGEDGRGMNVLSNGVIAMAKSWALESLQVRSIFYDDF